MAGTSTISLHGIVSATQEYKHFKSFTSMNFIFTDNYGNTAEVTLFSEPTVGELQITQLSTKDYRDEE